MIFVDHELVDDVRSELLELDCACVSPDSKCNNCIIETKISKLLNRIEEID